MGRREESREARRQRALEAARRLIAKGGVEALSLRALAREADLAVNTVYALLGRSRDAILASVVADGIEELGRTLADRAIRDPLAAGVALAETVTDYVIERGDLFRPVVLAGDRADGNWGRDAALAQGRALLEAARAEGRIRSGFDLELVAEQIDLAFRGWARRWARGEIGDAHFRRGFVHATQLALLAVASDSARPEIERAIRRLERAPRKGALR